MSIVQEPSDPAFMAVVPFGLQQEGEPVPQGQLVQLVCLIEGFWLSLLSYLLIFRLDFHMK